MGLSFKIAIASILGSLLVGCINPYVTEMKQVDPRGWSGADVVCVDYESEDTLSFFKLSLIIRVNKGYSEDGLVLKVATSDSTNLEAFDEVNVITNSRKVGISRYEDIIIPFRDSVQFGSGGYEFCITHNKSHVFAIHSVGVDITRLY